MQSIPSNYKSRGRRNADLKPETQPDSARSDTHWRRKDFESSYGWVKYKKGEINLLLFPVVVRNDFHLDRVVISLCHR